MFALVETGGKQLKLIPGQTAQIEKLQHAKGDKVSLSNVLMITDGKNSKIGNPYIKGAVVNGHILDNLKGQKIIVYKMRPKKGTRKKQGHRQWISKIFIDNIELDGKVIVTSEEYKKLKQESKGLINQTPTKKKKEV